MRPRRRRGSRVVAVALGCALLGGVGLAIVRALAVASPQAAAAPALATARVPFAPSLAGTSTEGIAPAAMGAALVLEPGLIRLFDHYLTTLGERTLAEIRAQILRELALRYAPAAARQAQEVLDRYLAYKEALRAEAPAAPRAGRGADLLHERLRAMHAIRSRYFDDAESQALFGPDDREAAEALARLAVAQDPTLDAA